MYRNTYVNHLKAQRFTKMSETILITQSPVPPPIIQGTYRWLLANVHEQPPDQENADWALETVPQVAQQYELFSPYMADEAQFQQLVRQWHAERGTKSSTTEIVLCASYQAIIGMGRAVAIPLILAQMEADGEHPDQWFWALQVLTGSNPVSEDDEGDFPKMAKSWLQWASYRGYVR